MRDVIPDNVAYEKGCEVNTNYWEYKIQPVERINFEALGEDGLYLMDKCMKNVGSERGQYTYDKSQDK